MRTLSIASSPLPGTRGPRLAPTSSKGLRRRCTTRPAQLDRAARRESLYCTESRGNSTSARASDPFPRRRRPQARHRIRPGGRKWSRARGCRFTTRRTRWLERAAPVMLRPGELRQSRSPFILRSTRSFAEALTGAPIAAANRPDGRRGASRWRAAPWGSRGLGAPHASSCGLAADRRSARAGGESAAGRGGGSAKKRKREEKAEVARRCSAMASVTPASAAARAA